MCRATAESLTNVATITKAGRHYLSSGKIFFFFKVSQLLFKSTLKQIAADRILPLSNLKLKEPARVIMQLFDYSIYYPYRQVVKQ